MAAFIDRVTVHVSAGNGGHGVSSVHREKFKPLGGPDGGNGGDGGDVVLEVDPSVHTLLDFHHHPHQKAAQRQARRRQQPQRRPAARTPCCASPRAPWSPPPTARSLADLMGVGTRVVLAAGGRGGLGNAALANARRKAPGFALLGEPGEAVDAVLELKSVADVGLVGFPSAGKSSLVAAMSAARPKIADYPFTTLVPNLGVIRSGDVTYTMADVPGPDPRRVHRARAGPAVPPARRALCRPGARRRHGDDGARAATRRATSRPWSTSCASTTTSSTWSAG